MNISDFYKDFYKNIQKVDLVSPENKELTELVKMHISKLQKSHDEFISKAKADGYSLQNPQIGATEVQFLTLIKALSEKIGLPVERYDRAIKNIQIRVFGEDGYKKFFEQATK